MVVSSRARMFTASPTSKPNAQETATVVVLLEEIIVAAQLEVEMSTTAVEAESMTVVEDTTETTTIAAALLHANRIPIRHTTIATATLVLQAEAHLVAVLSMIILHHARGMMIHMRRQLEGMRSVMTT
jgi:hypothetical protein